MVTKPLEKEIQLAICDYLAMKKHFFWRQNTNGMYDPTKKVFRAMPKYSMNGVPDIIVVKDGYFIGLEVKRKGSKQSQGQKDFEKLCKEAGGEYYVVSSIDDLVEVGL